MTVSLLLSALTPASSATARTQKNSSSSPRLGLKPLEAIRAATLEAAKAVGLADQIGVLKGGALADIIAVEGNPLNDLTALQKVTFVMKAGRPIDPVAPL